MFMYFIFSSIISNHMNVTIVEDILSPIDLSQFDCVFHRLSSELNSQDPTTRQAAKAFHVCC